MSRSDFVRSAASTCFGRSSVAGACDAWKSEGTPSGRRTHPSDATMSTLSRSETGPSSSTFPWFTRSRVNR
eukprot:6199894-Pleurochrysis_carterae.AAC.1